MSVIWPVVLFFLFLSSFPAWAQDGEIKQNEADQKASSGSVRLPSDIAVPRTHDELISVPVFFRNPGFLPNHGQANALHIGLDYDELLLHFIVESLYDSVGDKVVSIQDDSEEGQLSLTVTFDAEKALQEDEILIWLHFKLSPWLSLPLGKDYAYRLNTPLTLSRQETFFLSSGGSQIVPQLWDGSITIYLQDILELGSGSITPDRQIFQVPVYVTHLRSEPAYFTMGLDYDELSLMLLDVRPAEDCGCILPEDIVWFEGNKSNPESPDAFITAKFTGGIYPQLVREHVLDLVFEFTPEISGTVPNSYLNITPLAISSPDGKGGAFDAAAEETPHPTFIKEGRVYVQQRQFIRGDANNSRSLDLADVRAILEATFLGTDLIRCKEAADVDNNGSIDISDSIWLMNYLYAGGHPPAAPFPELGPDADADFEKNSHLGCEAYEDPVFQLWDKEESL